MYYQVIWELDEVWAESHVDAARKALAIQRDPQYKATVFLVTDDNGVVRQVDLEDEDHRAN